MDESLDVPILEEQSSSPTEFLQEQWLVATDIENIEGYAVWETDPYSHIYQLLCPANSLSVAFFPQWYERNAESAKQTSGNHAITTEEPRCSKIPLMNI